MAGEDHRPGGERVDRRFDAVDGVVIESRIAAADRAGENRVTGDEKGFSEAVDEVADGRVEMAGEIDGADREIAAPEFLSGAEGDAPGISGPNFSQVKAGSPAM